MRVKIEMTLEEVKDLVRCSNDFEDGFDFELVITDLTEAAEDLSNCVESNFQKNNRSYQFFVEKGFEDMLGISPACRHALNDETNPSQYSIYTEYSRLLALRVTELAARRYVALGEEPK